MGKGEEMKFIIPMIPPSDNQFKGRQNVWEYRELKKQWLDTVMMLCRPKPQKPISKAEVTLTYFFKTKRRHDPDNYAGKFILDGLVEGGILADDSFDNVDLRLRGRYDPKNPRTEITIQEVVE
jgi:crossover junction endodeoxyribonuclease RusA